VRQATPPERQVFVRSGKGTASLGGRKRELFDRVEQQLTTGVALQQAVRLDIAGRAIDERLLAA